MQSEPKSGPRNQSGKKTIFKNRYYIKRTYGKPNEQLSPKKSLLPNCSVGFPLPLDAALFYYGTPLAFHIIISNMTDESSTETDIKTSNKIP